MKTVIVSAAVLIEQGRVLLTQRKSGTHLAGAWEFPGGKVEPGEDPRDALRRELREEVGVEVSVGEIVDVTFHRYEEAEKAVILLFFEARREPGSGEPRALDVAAVRWAAAGDLCERDFPPADVAVLRKVAAKLGAES
jgi:8-oxo-dGTP diphosphatase